MAITQAIANTFKQEILVGTHNFTISSGDVFKIALYLGTATLSSATTTYNNTGEVATGGGYTQTGISLTNVTPFLDGSTAVVDFDPDVTWSSSTITAGGAQIYNSSKSNKTVLVLNFGGDKVSSAGDFTVVFPNPVAATAIIRIA